MAVPVYQYTQHAPARRGRNGGNTRRPALRRSRVERVAPMIILVTGAADSSGGISSNGCGCTHIELYEYDLGLPEQQLCDGWAGPTWSFIGGREPAENAWEYETETPGSRRKFATGSSPAAKRPKLSLPPRLQAELDNPYGRSKLQAEQCLRR